MADEATVPSFRLREEAEKRRAAEKRCDELERENQACRSAIVARGADPKEIIAAMG
jgi:hypothetical protein